MIVLTCWVPGKAEITRETESGLRAACAGRTLWADRDGSCVPGVGQVAHGDIIWRLYELDPDDDKAYGRAVASYWTIGHDLLVLEPDVEVGPNTLFEFAACQYGYCAAPYPWDSDIGPALGCTRFTARFMREHPTLAREAVAENVGFRQFDTTLMRIVMVARYGLQPHVHAPVIHHNPLKQLRDGASPEPLRELPVW